ncbi:hypothetical protein CEXT_120031 [Caerostris extrusa]|uniref:Uncharacterized protein n=1 Tax=Caerostris extrusa TaxID=172846 RepID=A0AAV4RK91_CAEEX|nr:hypothetical protein CEXT_120031 [Caerostris extrusa]
MSDKTVFLAKGMKLAQIVFQLHWCLTFQQVEYTYRSSTDTEVRGTRGFGGDEFENVVHNCGSSVIEKIEANEDRHFRKGFAGYISSGGAPQTTICSASWCFLQTSLAVCLDCNTRQREWGCLLRKVTPFMLRLRVDRVLMFWMLPNEMFGKMIDNFARTTKEASVQNEFEPEKYFLTNSTNDTASRCMQKENTDVRLGYRVDTNTFLVKAYSTFE